MLEKRTAVDLIEVKPNGLIQIRLLREVVEDGVSLAGSNHRIILEPGTDLTKWQADIAETESPAPDLTQVINIATTLFTPDVIAAYQAASAAGSSMT